MGDKLMLCVTDQRDINDDDMSISDND